MTARYHALPESIRQSVEALAIVAGSLALMFGSAFGIVAALVAPR